MKQAYSGAFVSTHKVEEELLALGKQGHQAVAVELTDLPSGQSTAEAEAIVQALPQSRAGHEHPPPASVAIRCSLAARASGALPDECRKAALHLGRRVEHRAVGVQPVIRKVDAGGAAAERVEEDAARAAWAVLAQAVSECRSQSARPFQMRAAAKQPHLSALTS